MWTGGVVLGLLLSLDMGVEEVGGGKRERER